MLVGKFGFLGPGYAGLWGGGLEWGSCDGDAIAGEGDFPSWWWVGWLLVYEPRVGAEDEDGG